MRPAKSFFVTFCLALLLAGCASAPKGAFVKPIDGIVSSHYGPRGGRMHKGIDVAAPKGTEVRAAQAGRVIFRGRQRGFGKLIIIDHGGGTETYYAHLSRFRVRKGAKVKRGARIGHVGKTGNAKKPHLHFELRIAGKPVDPSGVVPFH